jgi:flagellar biosynthesis protein FliR
MHADPAITLLCGFLLVLTRVAGTFLFVPLPGIRNGPEPVRAVLSLSTTLTLFAVWPAMSPENLTMGRMTGLMLGELALGLAIGVAVSFLTEALLLSAQFVGLQAGYAYASTIDPNTNADAGVLLVFTQLLAGMLFLSLGLDREVIRIFAGSLETHPPGTFIAVRPALETMMRLGTSMFSTALRLAMPVLALLLLVDLGLALLGRLNSQLQLITLTFPVKMLVAIALLAWISVLFPVVYRGSAREVFEAARAMVR